MVIKNAYRLFRGGYCCRWEVGFREGVCILWYLKCNEVVERVIMAEIGNAILDMPLYGVLSSLLQSIGSQ
jgi:hypothetical protein